MFDNLDAQVLFHIIYSPMPYTYLSATVITMSKVTGTYSTIFPLSLVTALDVLLLLGRLLPLSNLRDWTRLNRFNDVMGHTLPLFHIVHIVSQKLVRKWDKYEWKKDSGTGDCYSGQSRLSW